MGSIPEPGLPRSAGLTYEDYLQLPDNEGTRYEILDGELAVTPSPTTVHQRVSRKLLRLLDEHVTGQSLGEVFDAPTDVILANTSITVPDLLYVRVDRASIITRRAIEGPPDLIVEIVSPTTSKRDRGAKAKLYARYGVAHYWIVDPDERWIELHELDGGVYRLATRAEGTATVRSSLFPLLEISLEQIFA